MMLIDEEMVEKAARAIHDAGWTGEVIASQRPWAIYARVALEAVLPMLVDRIREELGKAEGAGLTEDALWEAQEIIRMMVFCPRSMNHRPDNFLIADCVAAGECGCGATADLTPNSPENPSIPTLSQAQRKD